MNKPLSIQLLPLLLFGLLSSCSEQQGASSTAQVGQTSRASGDSRVLSFRRIAVMDTITAVLEGKAVSLCNQSPLPVTVRLMAGTTSYQAVAASDGTFRFHHIPAGKYALTATHPTYHSVAPSPVELGTGHVAEVTVGLACTSAKP